MEFFGRARDWIAAREDAIAGVTVVETRGSVPRHVGSRMLVDARGQQFGTIGGGRVEAEITALAAAVASGDKPGQVASHHLVRDLAMCCGGSMTFLVAPITEVAIIGAIADKLSAREPVGIVQTTEALTLRPPGKRSHAAEFGDERFADTLWPRDRAIVFGAGHVSRALVPLLSQTGFEVIVCDDNELGALELIEGSVDRAIASFEPFDVERALGSLGPGDYVLVVTRDHAVDQRLIEKLLPKTELGYLGLIGSRGKIGRFHKRILAKGLVTDEHWSRLHAPIGIDIGAETPAEIAVSICAQLVSIRNHRRRGEE